MFALRDFWGQGWALRERQVLYRAVKTRYERQYHFTLQESPYGEQKKKNKKQPTKLVLNLSSNQKSQRQKLQTVGTGLRLSPYLSRQLKAAHSR